MKRNSVLFCLSLLLSGLFPVSLLSQGVEFDVLHYGITLNVDNEQENRHIGFTDVDMRFLSSGNDYLMLDLRSQSVDSVFFNDQNVEFEYSNNKIKVLLPSTVSPNEQAQIRVYYNGGMNIEPYGWGGLHYTQNIIYNLGVAFEDYPHAYGRAWFACKDSFTDKARFSFHITVGKDVRAVCSGVLDSISYSETADTYHYTLEQEISTYLASMAIADFKLLERELSSVNGTVPLHVYYFASDSVGVYRNFENFEAVFANMENLYGAFPFNRVGYSTTPLGSMEHVDNIGFALSLASSFSANAQSVMVHEFAHSWFGNLMTCETSGDMWINEGWTTFTEKANLEAMYGADYAKEHFRKKIVSVISKLPRTEGVFALSGVDSTRTYSSTVYDKGALVAMSLKTYMGDSLFYSSLRKLLGDFAYSNINSATLRDSLSSYSGINLDAFFEAYVFDTIMHHFAIQRAEFGNNSAKITLNSRTLGADDMPCLAARVPITFMDENFNTCKRQIIDNGTQTPYSFSLPFTPIAAFLDMEEEFFDLTTDAYKWINAEGLTKYESSYFRVMARNLTDSVLVRATLNWVGEREDKQINGVSRLSKKHYWTIEGVNLDKADLEAKFYYQFSASASGFDPELTPSSSCADSLLLLYRPNMESDWQYVEIERPSSGSGYITVPLRVGDYIMAVGDKAVVGLALPKAKEQNSIKIYPQPSKGKINIEFSKPQSHSTLSVFDSTGRKVAERKLAEGLERLTWDLNLSSGNYVLCLEAENGVESLNFVVK